jgi:hypothetical protein
LKIITFFDVIRHISSDQKSSIAEIVIVFNKGKNSEMDFCSKLMQPVSQADFKYGNTLLLIMVFLFVQEQVLFNKIPHLLMYLHCSYVHGLWYHPN